MKAFITILVILACTQLSNAQITGTIFNDYNDDGIQQTAFPDFEPPIQGVIINAFDDNNAIINTTSSAGDGTYSLPFIDTVRLEFELPLNNPCFSQIKYFSSVVPSGENIRFITTSTANVNYAIHYPSDFITNYNPDVFVARINEGDPLVSGISANEVSIFGHPHTLTSSTSNNSGTLSSNILLSDQIGSVWGMAYSKHAKKIFTSAFLKRFCGMGPMGSGGIYMLEPTVNSFNVTNFYNMDANGHRTRANTTAVPFGNGSSFNIIAGTQATYLGPIDVASGAPEGLGVIGVNGTGGRELTSGISGTWADPSVFDQICKVGIGDIDISDDGRFLFLTNLYDRKIYRLELDNVMNPQSVVAVTSYNLPNLSVTNGLLRAFGLCSHHGKIYIGAVSSGENGGQVILNGTTDVYAYVFEMIDPMGIPSINSTPVFSLPLNYEKSSVGLGGGPLGKQWHPWSNNTATFSAGGEKGYPTPVLSDIGFTPRGDMIIDLLDRSSHQFSYGGKMDLNGISSVSFVTGGDILIAGVNCTTGQFTIENNGSYNSNGVNHVGWSVANNQGVGGGEFFNDKGEHDGSLGSLACIPRKDTFLATIMNPEQILNNGTMYLNTLNGTASNPLLLANSQQSGKNNSMGDIELAGDAPLIQIGNRVWLDKDGDGIQDPTESGIQNVTLELFSDFNNDDIPDGAALGTSTTNITGNFLFDSNNVSDGDPVTPGVQAGPIAYRKYLIQVANSDWASGIGTNQLLGYSLTLTDVGGNGQADVRDNDAQLINSIPTIKAFTGMNGNNNHSHDMGFISCKVMSLADITLNCDLKEIMIGPVSEIGNTYLWNPPTGLSNANIAQPNASPTISTSYILTINGFCNYPINVNVDTILPIADAGKTQSVDCKTKSIMIGTPAIADVSYSWLPIAGLDNPNIAQPIASPTVTTTYTLTVTGLNGCNNSSTTKVIVDECCTRVVIPNSFTPNGDKLNDDFGVIELENLNSFKLMVYNRWGQKLFETETKEAKWDGNFNGKKCEMGTYFYLMSYDCGPDNKKILKGDVTLVR